ncbi:M3 family metallopeptidase [Microbacterium hydrocarbonoxydans]|uniref:M3 family metallopeptidase n=1 Tax=Microbacterium hydrocarbonoxydans TaxID=273678 RepID=UPI00203C9829|nr:M3 family metallopeptidase [Microbacterium hydrocarbonoxydans]MCM3780969.1 M3 family metallopeptidase [Microbacterium hydrocarbonoxydans]
MTDAPNPLLQPSTLPYGLPDYTRIRPEHYLPAFRAAFDEHRREVSRITMVRSMPTFENTIEALERSGELLERVSHAFYTVSSADATPEIQAVDEQLAPLMAAHHDAVTLDGALYWRVQQVHSQLDDLDLDAEQRYLVERHYREMTHAGAALDDEAKARLTLLNQQLSTLSNTFERNLLNDTNDLAVVFETEDELAGLGAGELSAAARSAAERGVDGYVVSLPLFTGHPYLSQLKNRESRRRIMEASRSRASRGNANDNRSVLIEIARLRAERAALLGYPSHAAYVTADETAGTPEAVERMLRELAAPSARNASTERAALQEIVDELEPEPFPVEAHDWAFYTEKVRAARYDIDTAALRPWFEAERVLHDGVFFAATQLYGVTFAERADLVAYHPGARVFEVRNDDGSELGLYVLDLYTRDSKRGGAWMNPIVSQSRLRGTRPVVVNNLNVPQPADGEPTLLTLDEVTTLFHEFGHALHGLFAVVTYPHFAGTNVFRDFVEFPSQVNEMWILWPEVLDNYARHHVTGEPLDAAVIERLRSAETFDQGHATSEYLAAAWLDQAWHRIGPDESVTDAAAFEASALSEIGLDDPAVPTRYSSAYFAHVFSGGYSAGYYSYIWSEVLDADTVDWFRENGGLTRENGDRFRQRLLGVGGSKDPLEAYRDFRGRDAEIAPLLKRRGLTP